MDKEHCSALVDVNVNVNANPNVAEVDVDNNVIRSALMNPVIIKEIFGYLTIDKVKDARSVCKIWESVGTACLGRRCYFSINKFCRHDDMTGTLLSLPIKDQLVRSVNIDYFGLGGGVEKRMDYAFIAFVAKYREQIEELRFDVNRHFAPTIKWVLENVKFSKLKTITLNEYHHKTWSIAGCGMDSLDNLKFLSMPTVTTLMICAEEEMEGRDGPFRVDEKDGFPYYQIFQEVIKKSSNLERLVIKENFYPDLSCCRKLKVLECMGYSFKPFADEDEMGVPIGEQQIEIREDFSLSKMLKMMDQVKDTLEELIIDTGPVDRYKKKVEIPVPLDQANIKFPCFPCLKILEVDPIDVYMPGFQKMSQDGLPGLQQLALEELDEEKGCLNNVLLTMTTRWTNVKYLMLNGLQYERDDPSVVINKIAKTFPNIAEFHVWIKGDVEMEATPKYFQRFKDALFAIGTSNWNIQHLEIRIEFVLTLSKLMDALGEVALVEGFKRLKTIKISSTHIRDEGCDNFDKPFMALRRTTFEEIKFKQSTLIKMLQFIRHHDLDINFLYDD